MEVRKIAFFDINQLDSFKLERSRESACTLVVREDADAVEVAAEAEQGGFPLVLLTDIKGDISGLIAPKLLTQAIETWRGRNFPKLSVALQEIDWHSSEISWEDFQLEWHSSGRATPVWCHKGGHFIDEEPCAVHGANR